MWHRLPPLLDSIDDKGNMIAGHLSIPAIVNLLCQHSFGADKPWVPLLHHPNSALAHNIQTCWTRLQQAYQQIVGQQEEEKSKLATQDIEKAGTYESDKLPFSVTREITVEIEEGDRETLARHFGAWPPNAQEHITWYNVNLSSSQFLTAPPDGTGTMPDNKFREIFTQYLGLPSPCCVPFVGQWIRLARNQHQVDEHSNAVFAQTAVPGAGHTIAHNATQATAGDIAKTTSIQLQLEAENVFHGRVSK
eukprot:7568861-Ditylum_brightwellii.AAC.1